MKFDKDTGAPQFSHKELASMGDALERNGGPGVFLTVDDVNLLLRSEYRKRLPKPARKTSDRVVGKAKGEIDVKRFYIPGVIVKSTCPDCRADHERDLAEDYLSNPEIGKPEAIYFNCEADKEDGTFCDAEWEVPVVIDISVQLA